MFASLPLYILTTLFAFGCVSELLSALKHPLRVQSYVPEEDPGILPSVPEQDYEILPTVPEQDPGILTSMPKQDTGILQSVSEQDPGILENIEAALGNPCPHS